MVLVHFKALQGSEPNSSLSDEWPSNTYAAPVSSVWALVGLVIHTLGASLLVDTEMLAEELNPLPFVAVAVTVRVRGVRNRKFTEGPVAMPPSLSECHVTGHELGQWASRSVTPR